MIHSLENIAETHRLELKAFVAFAVRNEARFGVFYQHGSWMTSSWHVNALVKEFELVAAQGLYVDQEGFTQFVGAPPDGFLASVRNAGSNGQNYVAVDVVASDGFVIETSVRHSSIGCLEQAGVDVVFSWMIRSEDALQCSRCSNT